MVRHWIQNFGYNCGSTLHWRTADQSGGMTDAGDSWSVKKSNIVRASLNCTQKSPHFDEGSHKCGTSSWTFCSCNNTTHENVQFPVTYYYIRVEYNNFFWSVRTGQLTKDQVWFKESKSKISARTSARSSKF